MDRLIELILNNIVFVIIIISVVISFLSKASRAGQGQPSQGMPPFGTPVDGRRENAPQEARRSVPPISRREPSYSVQEPPRTPKAPEPMFEWSGEGRDSRPQPVRMPQRAPAISDSSSPIYQFRGEQDLGKKAVEGMIWAEVFGPPRSKRKHNR